MKRNFDSNYLNRYFQVRSGNAIPSWYRFHKNSSSCCTPSLDERYARAMELVSPCRLCFRSCGAERLACETGFCSISGTGGVVTVQAVLCGEEAPVNPTYEIFLAGCNLRCGFCYERDWITPPIEKVPESPQTMARRIAANVPDRAVNFHWVGGEPLIHLPWILDVLRNMTHPVPMIWNSNMTFNSSVLEIFTNLPDLILADIHFGNPRCAEAMGAPGQSIKAAQNSILHLSRFTDMILRYLYLPGHLECCLIPILEWMRDHISCVPVHIMGQYVPPVKPSNLDLREVRVVPVRRPEPPEIAEARRIAESMGLTTISGVDDVSGNAGVDAGFETEITVFPDGTVAFQNLASDFQSMIANLSPNHLNRTPPQE